MPAFLLPLLLKLAPYIALVVAAIAAYFGIRHQGAKAAIEKSQRQQEAARVQVEKKIAIAESKDEAIDAKVQEQIDAIKKTTDDSFAGDRFKF